MKTSYKYKTVNILSQLISEEKELRRAKGRDNWRKQDIINELSVLTGMSFDSISSIKKNTNQPNVATAIIISKFFGKDVESVFKVVKAR